MIGKGDVNVRWSPKISKHWRGSPFGYRADLSAACLLIRRPGIVRGARFRKTGPTLPCGIGR